MVKYTTKNAKLLKRKNNLCVFWGIFAVFVGLFFITSNLFSEEFAPNFKLKDIEDKEYILFDFSGKDLILFFWTTWCPYCIRELQNLERKFLSLKSRGKELLSINIGESKERIKRFSQRYGLTFPILLDEDYRVSRQYGLFGVPTYVLIDKNGRIKFFGHYLPKDYNQ